MKRMIAITLAAASIAAPALAAPWQSINAQQAQIDRRIDQGVRQGSLTRGEAVRLRSQFRNIVQLESRYRRSEGRLTAGERADLDTRLTALKARVFVNKHDAQRRG